MAQPHRTVSAALLAVLAGSALTGSALAAPNAARLQARGNIEQLHPGVMFAESFGRTTHVYGKPMTAGVTAKAAADTWINQYAAVLGLENTTLTEAWSTAADNGKFTVVSYQQSIDGMPVEFGNVQVLVLNQPFPRVVMVTNMGVERPDFMPAPRMTGEMAVALVRAQALYKGLPQWSAPERAILQVEEEQGVRAVPVWKFTGSSPNPADEKAYTFFVNIVTGKLEQARSEIYYMGNGVSGTITGNYTPPPFPDSTLNPPVAIGMPNMRVTAGSASVFTNRDGTYVLAPAAGPVTVNASVQATGGGGLWVNIIPNDGAPVVAGALANVSVPGTANILLNPTPAESLTSQVNTFLYTTITHNFLKDRLPGFNAISIPITANTGVAGTCNAFFSPTAISINFYNTGGGCVNTAYASVISHEWGHFVVNRRGLAQGNFGEGYGDSLGMLIYDDPIVGRDFRGPGTNTFVRDPLASPVVVNCTGGSSVHYCGQLLGKSWYRIRTELGSSLGSQQGLARARDIFAAWTVATAGWGPSGAATAGNNLPIEILTVDDNDGDLSNGTPNRNAICAALGAANNGPGFTCPALSLASFSFPNGRPNELVGGQSTSIAVNVGAGGSTPIAGSGEILYRPLGSSTFTTASMNQVAPNQYIATLPAVPCPQGYEYYFRVNTAAGSQTNPIDAPATLYRASVPATGAASTLADLNFNADPGWTVTNDTGLTTGAWQRGTPVTYSFASPVAPLADADASGQCWVTDNRAGTGVGTYDIDGGATRLTTGAFDLSGAGNATLSYSRWFTTTGTDDVFRAEASADNGSTWVTLENVTATAGNNWVPRTINVSSFIPLTSQVRFRFTAADLGTGHVVEAGLDAFRVTSQACATAPACYANCDGSSNAPVLNALDFACFLTRYNAGESYANCDGSTNAPVLNALDFGCFLSRYTVGCP